MANITPDFDEALEKHEARVQRSRRQRSHISDEFLKEAYRIVGLMALQRITLD